MPDEPTFPRVDEIAPYLPDDQSYALLAVQLATARWENAALRELLKSKEAGPASESGDV